MSNSIIQVRTGACKSKNGKNQIMNNTGFGKVNIVREGIKRLTAIELLTMTVADAQAFYEKTGLGVIVA